MATAMPTETGSSPSVEPQDSTFRTMGKENGGIFTPKFRTPRGMLAAPVLIVGNTLVATGVTQLWRPGPHVLARRVAALVIAVAWFSLLVIRPVILSRIGADTTLRQQPSRDKRKKGAEKVPAL